MYKKIPKVKIIKIDKNKYKCSCKDTDDDIVDIIPSSSKLDAERQFRKLYPNFWNKDLPGEML